MYLGWMSYAGIEIANAARTKAYVDHVGVEGISVYDCGGCDNFHEVMGDKPYTSPFVDQPEWMDPNNPDTWDFLGYMPLSAEGVEDSTITGTPIELSTDGGYVTGQRFAGREMRFTGILIGRHEAAVQAGMTWLKQVLYGDVCRRTGGCSGDHFCYLSACPEMCEDSPNIYDLTPSPALQENGGGTAVLQDPLVERAQGWPPRTRLCPTGENSEWQDQCVMPYERHMLNVTCIEGPLVTKIHESACGIPLWEVEFTLYAGVPGPFGTPRFVARFDPDLYPSRVIDNIACDPDQGIIPIQDPDCLVPLPPRPPLILDDCITRPSDYRRYKLRIDDDFIPQWSDTVPVIRIRTRKEDAKQVRVRFYSDPFQRHDEDSGYLDEDCTYCGEFLISYIPKNSLLVIDGMDRSAYIETYDAVTATSFNSQRFSATHLLYGDGGTPMTWPVLSCGITYTMTVDVAPDKISQLQVSLCLASKE